MRIQSEARVKLGGGAFAIERYEVVFSGEPILKLIPIVGAAAMT